MMMKDRVAHSTAKSGLDAFVRSLALELGPHGIRINVVAPGLTITDATAFLPQEAKDASARATPLGRNAEPEDIAGVVLAMASGATAFVTGTSFPWEQREETITIGCPDHINQVVWKLDRIGEC